MKTTTMPALRVQPELRRTQREFIARGLAARDAARKSGAYFSPEEILQELDHILGSIRKKVSK